MARAVNSYRGARRKPRAHSSGTAADETVSSDFSVYQVGRVRLEDERCPQNAPLRFAFRLPRAPERAPPALAPGCSVTGLEGEATDHVAIDAIGLADDKAAVRRKQRLGLSRRHPIGIAECGLVGPLQVGTAIERQPRATAHTRIQ